jgi:outer membrane protein assembly factor BamB
MMPPAGPPHTWETAYRETREALDGDRIALDPPLGEAPITLSTWARVGKLAAAVGDLGKALRQTGLGADAWRRAEAAYAPLLHDGGLRARRDVAIERADIARDVAAIQASRPRESTTLLEPEATMVAAPGGGVWVVGHRWSTNAAPHVRAVSGTSIVWDAGPLDGTTMPLAPDAYRVVGHELLVAHQGVLAAFELATGRATWRVAVDGAIVAAQGERLLVQRGSTLFALERGVRLWSRDEAAALAPSNEGLFVWTPTWIAALDWSTGATRWRKEEERIAAVFPARDRVWLRLHRALGGGAWWSGISALAVDGSVAVAPVEAPVSDALPPVLGIWGGAAPGTLTAVDAHGAHRVLPLADPDRVVRQLAELGGLALAVTEHRMRGGRRLAAFGAEGLAWESEELGPAPAPSAPTLVVGEGLAYVATDVLSAFDARGTLRWRRPLQGWAGHTAIAGHVVSRSHHPHADRIEALAAPDGHLVASFP